MTPHRQDLRRGVRTAVIVAAPVFVPLGVAAVAIALLECVAPVLPAHGLGRLAATEVRVEDTGTVLVTDAGAHQRVVRFPLDGCGFTGLSDGMGVTTAWHSPTCPRGR